MKNEQIEANWKKCRIETYGFELDDTRNSVQFSDEFNGFDEENEEISDESDFRTSVIETEIDFHFDDYVAKFVRVDILKW